MQYEELKVYVNKLCCNFSVELYGSRIVNQRLRLYLPNTVKAAD